MGIYYAPKSWYTIIGKGAKMRNLLLNELLKLKRSKAVKVIFWYFVLFAAFTALSVNPRDESSIMNYGFSAPFLAFGSSGALGFFIYAAIAAGLIAEEFSLGTIHNTLGCGVDRRKYFIAKVFTASGITVFIYLCNVLAHCLVKMAAFPFDPDGVLYSHYWLKVLVYNLAAIILQLCYMSFYICISYLCRSSVMTFVLSMAITIAAINHGPMRVMWEMLNMARTAASSDRLLSADFALMLIPSICLGVISLLAAYLLFRKADIN